MTRDELNRRRMMFQIYANRNKMPQLQKNNNEEPVAHSATNDFLEYRKKVAAGTRMQRENNKSNLFNVTAANEQYHQDLMDQNIIIHAGMNNQYIAKLDDFYGKGKPRYFYDQAEWDNYRKNMQGARQTGADRAAKEGADAKNKALANKAQEAFTRSSADYKNKELADKAQEAFTKSSADYKNKELANKAQEAFTKSTADYKNKELANKAQEAFNNSPAANTEFRTSTDAYKNKDLLESNQKSKENAVKRSDPEYQKELEKARSIKEDKDRWGAYSESDLKEISKDKRFSNIKTEDDAVNYPGGVEKLYNDVEAALEEKFPGKKKNYEASKNAGADRAAKESKTANDQKADKINKKNWEHNARQNGINRIEEDGTIHRNAENAGRDRAEKELINRATDPNDPKLNKIADSFTRNSGEATGKKMKLIMNRQDKNGVSYSVEPAKKKAKHSSLEDGITTSDDTTSDQEYLNFRARVEAGLKHFGQTRGLMSVHVNQALKNGESLSHAGYKPAGTHEYVAKIDNAFGPGKHRYFYSKEEWDNYNNYKRNEDYAKNAGADKAKKEKYNANYESNIKKNEGYAQNAGADRAKQEKLSYDADSARKDVDNLFKNGYQQTNEKIALNSKIKDDYVHDAFNQALAEANGTTVEKLRKDPGLRSKLLEEFNEGTDYEKVIKVSQLMNNYYDALIDQDTNYVLNSIDFVKDYYHNGNPTGKGNTYSTSYKKDGFAIAKDLEDKWNTAIGNGKKNKSEVFVDFLKSLTDDERDVINMVNDYHYNNRLPGLLRQSQEGREAAEKEGQIITRRNTERNKYHLLNN